jgi:hypothetical protein
MILTGRLTVVRGCVAEIELVPAAPGTAGRPRHRLAVTQMSGHVRVLLIDAFATSLAAGHAVTLWVRSNQSAQVLAYVDHTAVDGANLVRCNARMRPDQWDMVMASAAATAAVMAMGPGGLVMLLPLGTAYWIVSHLLPSQFRQLLIRDLDVLMTRESRTGLSATGRDASA